MNNISQVIMSVAYILFFLAVIPNYISLFKHRNGLKGFSKIGTPLTAIGLTFCQIALYLDGAYIPFLIGFPNHSYWILASYYLLRKNKY